MIWRLLIQVLLQSIFHCSNPISFSLHRILFLPGDSCSLTICLSENCERLWIRAMLCLVWQERHTAGSAIRPLSISTVMVNAQTWQRKKASLISGMSWEVRITMPLIVTSWSMSVRGWIRWKYEVIDKYMGESRDGEFKNFYITLEGTHCLGFITIRLVKSYTIQLVKSCTIQLIKSYTIRLIKSYTIRLVKSYTIRLVKSNTIRLVKSYTIRLVKSYTIRLVIYK